MLLMKESGPSSRPLSILVHKSLPSLLYLDLVILTIAFDLTLSKCLLHLTFVLVSFRLAVDWNFSSFSIIALSESTAGELFHFWGLQKR